MIDVLIPTRDRPAALAATLACLFAQDAHELRIVISDQGDRPVLDEPAVAAVIRTLRVTGREVEVHRRGRRGMAEQRQFLLDRARVRYALFLDDDVLLEPDVVGRLHRTIVAERCGLVGCGLIGASYAEDVRPDEQAVVPWAGPVEPEAIVPHDGAWPRARLHSAANLLHAARRLEPGHEVRYRIAWIGGCVLFDVDILRRAGGFEFWEQLPPEHAGEDVLAQLRVLREAGGCGLLPSGAWHQELETTVADRTCDAPLVLAIHG
jgi:glycosyltransferase involved in cell wall biosynthesis